MRRKMAATSAGITTAVLALVACSSGGGDGDGSSQTVNFFTNKAGWESSFDDVSAVSESNGLTLNFTGYSDQDVYDAFIKQAFRTNERPDLFTWQTGSSLEEIVDEGMVAPTTDIWTEAIDNGWVDEGLAADYTFGGEQYCVPLNQVYWVMYYNKAVYAENDLEVPQTWEDLLNNAQALVDNGVVPFYQRNIVFEFVWFQTILLGLDPDAYDGLADGSTSYTDPSVIEAMEIWHEMLQSGFFIEPGTTDPQTLLQTGDVAMMNFGTFVTGQLGDVGMISGEDYGIFAIPNVNPDLEERHVIVETSPLCVGADSVNEDAALEYSSWWMGDEAQSAWAESRGDLSFNPNATVADPALADITEEVSGEGNVIHTRYFEATPVPIYSVASEQFGAFVTNHGDPMAVLEAIQAEADVYWSEN